MSGNVWAGEPLRRHPSPVLSDAILHGARVHSDAQISFWRGGEVDSVQLDDLYRDSSRVAGALYALGLRFADTIAIQMPNCVEAALIYQAALLLGLVIVPIVHIYGPMETGFIIRESRARALFVPDRWHTTDYIERLSKLDVGASLEHVVIVGDRVTKNAIRWSKLLEKASDAYPASVAVSNDLALLIYTSGTTAEPKGVRHSHAGLLAEIAQLQRQYDYPGATLTPWPAGHIAGALGLLRPFIFGGHAILMDRWNPQAAAGLLQQHNVSATSGAPVMLAGLLDAAAELHVDLHGIKGYATGGANVPPALVERADAAGLCVFRSYGCSEQPTITASNRVSDSLEKRAYTDGRVLDGVSLRLVDEEGHDVQSGNEGEIATTGAELCLGYRSEAMNAAAFLPDRWFRTGDIGRMDSDGFLTITDRKKDIIIRGGENISSKEVEDLLARHPGIAEAAVVGQLHDRLGETVCAFIIVKTGASVDVASIDRHFQSLGVARQKTPERVELVTELPRNASGKVRKIDLRKRLAGVE